MKEIGIVIIEYDQNGKVTSTFKPTIEIKDCQNVEQQIQEKLMPSNDPNVVSGLAETIFSKWFNLMTNIELNDNYNISHSVKNCEKYENGLVKICEIAFYYEDISLN